MIPKKLKDNNPELRQPYLIKIIRRKARHRKVETTLQYDHVSDDIVKEYFEKHQLLIK